MSDLDRASWWTKFEERVDATEVPLNEDLFANLTVDFHAGRVSWQDFEALKKALLGDPEDRSPVNMDVFTSKGWLTYTFEVDDLENIAWRELPNLIAFEGPASFREVVALAKSKYESRCGYITPTIQRLPRRLIEDMLEDLSRAGVSLTSAAP